MTEHRSHRELVESRQRALREHVDTLEAPVAKLSA
jgi:hypothetical protein